MDRLLPAARSILDGDALARRVERDYDLGPVQECRFWLGLNDTYAVAAGARRYMLRVYRRGWRAPADVAYEIDALLHLRARGAGVAGPVRRRDGRFVGDLAAPEGVRPCALFDRVPGREPSASLDDARAYGVAAAALHAAADDFRSRHGRFALDADYVVWSPVVAVRAFLADRPDDLAFLEQLAGRLASEIDGRAAAGLDRGFCHGDLHGGNAHRGEDGSVTFFDFDCCGPGFRAYDLAAYRWRQEWHGADVEPTWAAFLDGYRSARRLSPADEAAVPLFVAVRELWILGLHALTAPDRGHGWNVLDEGYLDRRLGFLRSSAARLFPP